MKQKCMVALRDGGRMIVEAYFLQAVPKLPEEGVKKYDSRDKREFSVDALVELNTFDCGSVYQIPFNRVKLVEEWAEIIE